MSDEGDRWFSVGRDRKREQHKLAMRAKRRAESAAKREEMLQRAFSNGNNNGGGTTPGIRMQITEWTYDEHGNMSRMIYSE